jgi:hypothetical protein
MKRFFGLLLSILLGQIIVAQPSIGGKPFGLRTGIEKAPVFRLSPINEEQLLAEDEQWRAQGDKSFRFGKDVLVNLNINTHGQWTTLNNGDRIWRLAIQSEGAKSLNLIFSRFNLPASSKLFVYTPNGETVKGAFTEANENKNGGFAILPIAGDKIIVEYYAPAGVTQNPELEISYVIHGYRSFTKDAKDFGGSGNCNNNVVCPEGNPWEAQIRSVVLLLTGNGTRYCSGAAINNTSNDGTPYVLTADHCGPGTNDIFVFNYKSPTCSPTQDWNLDAAVQGCTVRATNGGSDVCLVELDTEIPAEYNAFLAGWNRQNVPPPNSVSIHHPDTDVMKISFDENDAEIADFGGADCWHILNWEDGTTEPGSSGSPLFNENKQIIGQLFGGTANCNNNIDDYYGRFVTSWSGNQANARLRDWLDPSGSDLASVDGIEASIPQFQVDARLQSISTPSGEYCNTQTVTPSVIIRNSGVVTLTTLELSYGFAGNLQTFNWTGSLATNQTETINLPLLNGTFGNNLIFTATIANPNGVADEFPGNNSAQTTVNLREGTSYNFVIVSDDYPEETSFILRNTTTNTLVRELAVGSLPAGTSTYNFCLPNGCYRLIVRDSYGDGMVNPNTGTGSFTLYDDLNQLVGQGGEFNSSDTIIFCIGTIGIEELWKQADAVKLYPNPATSQLSLKVSDQILNEQPVYSVVNFAGQTIETGKLTAQNQQIQVSELPAGIYLLQLNAGNQQLTRKFVVER